MRRQEEPIARTERFDFPNSQGQQLAALLNLPETEPTAFALFAHCFTCGKDVLAAKRIADMCPAHRTLTHEVDIRTSSRQS